AARRAYEDFLHRRQDPALLEQSGGNEFTARVFPIPAKGMKELVLSYSHELVQQTGLGRRQKQRSQDSQAAKIVLLRYLNAAP
ncbi:MAG TPA: hypothetical protein PKD60_08555, partial [Turneriella sp.]|nr:hypothetical protein [Turneriella sp.]